MKPGDKVEVDGMVATVRCDVDHREYSPAYPEAEWADVFKTGLLVETVEAGLVHYADASRATLVQPLAPGREMPTMKTETAVATRSRR
jgi:hypothetical protein